MLSKIYKPSGSRSKDEKGYYEVELPDSVITKMQKKTAVKLKVLDGDINYRPVDIIVNLRYDDSCGNGHNSFGITADVYEAGRRSDSAYVMGGCCHEVIARHFPKLEKYIKWHMTSSDGPMHYLANTMYHASDRDHWGLRKDEKRQLVNGRTNLPVWQAVVKNRFGEEVPIHDSLAPGYGWVDSKEPPPRDGNIEWVPRWIVGEGKVPHLEHARSSAVWPDATLEQLQDEQALLDRLPALMEEFKRDMEELGFTY